MEICVFSKPLLLQGKHNATAAEKYGGGVAGKESKNGRKGYIAGNSASSVVSVKNGPDTITEKKFPKK